MRQHGTRAKYVVEKCRCEPCRNANREYARDRDRATRRPDAVVRGAYVSAGTARTHLLDLAELGLGRRRVAELSGVSQSILHEIRRGRKARISRSTRDRILAVSPVAAAGAHVDAATTWAHVAELLAAGWTKAGISGAIGHNGRALQLARDQVTARNARAIAELAAAERAKLESSAEYRSRAISAADEFEELYSTLASIVEERRAPWRRRAACNFAGIDVDVFYVARGESVEPARDVCSKCPVTAEYEAAGAGELFGLWGGLTLKQRRGNAA